MPSFEQMIWNYIKKFSKTVFAPILAIVIILGAILLAAMGCKELQIGGLLGSLFGKKSPDVKAVAVANAIPEGRIGADGKLIPEGQADPVGDTQAVVVPIKEPGLFSNPDTVQYTPPGATTDVTVQLPTGVKNRDVANVVIIKPEVLAVSVKDSSGVSLQKVDDLLKKFGV